LTISSAPSSPPAARAAATDAFLVAEPFAQLNDLDATGDRGAHELRQVALLQTAPHTK
jgi:hypothetical protein